MNVGGVGGWDAAGAAAEASSGECLGGDRLRSGAGFVAVRFGEAVLVWEGLDNWAKFKKVSFIYVGLGISMFYCTEWSEWCRTGWGNAGQCPARGGW